MWHRLLTMPLAGRSASHLFFHPSPRVVPYIFILYCVTLKPKLQLSFSLTMELSVICFFLLNGVNKPTAIGALSIKMKTAEALVLWVQSTMYSRLENENAVVFLLFWDLLKESWLLTLIGKNSIHMAVFHFFRKVVLHSCL